MKKTLVILMGVAMLAACGHKMSREEMMKEIEDHEYALDISYLDVDSADSVIAEMVDLYRQFYRQFPTDSLAPVYMQRTADMCITAGRNDEAVAVLDSIIALYPDFADLAGCWFLKGYAYQNAEQFDSARTAYTYFVDTYPDHYLAKDTRTTLQYLELSPEEMLAQILAGATDENLVME